MRMDSYDVAVQRAMAAEIRALLGYRNRSQAWLQREAGVPAPTWRKYFTEGAIERDVPMRVVRNIAEVLGVSAGELVTKAEDEAPRFMVDDIKGISDAERSELRAAVDSNRPQKQTLPTTRRRTGS